MRHIQAAFENRASARAAACYARIPQHYHHLSLSLPPTRFDIYPYLLLILYSSSCVYVCNTFLLLLLPAATAVYMYNITTTHSRVKHTVSAQNCRSVCIYTDTRMRYIHGEESRARIYMSVCVCVYTHGRLCGPIGDDGLSEKERESRSAV